MVGKKLYEIQKQYEWSKKGRKYKTKYFQALGQLFGAMQDDKDVQGKGLEAKTEKAIQRSPGTGQIRRVAEEK